MLLVITLVLTVAVQSEAVSVNPSLCPTNKIAPHRRSANWEPKPRTFGLIYSLLTPGRPRPPQNDLDELQEQPQEDDPDDCGEIEDYDETDLSSITPGAHNKVNINRKNRYLFDDNHVAPSYHYPVPTRPQRPPQRPPSHRPQRPQRPTYPAPKPPFYSGGIFGSNVYRPPTNHYPSNHIKPVHEDIYDDHQAAYHPNLVGGTLGHVVGFPLTKPLLSDEVSGQRPSSRIRFPDSDSYRTRQTRAKPASVSSRIIGSFVDLLFN